jgi:hypothetical protein
MLSPRRKDNKEKLFYCQDCVNFTVIQHLFNSALTEEEGQFFAIRLGRQPFNVSTCS